MVVHLVDGTFELFRCFHGAPRAEHDGREVGAARGLFATLVALLRDEHVTHIAVAFDSVLAPAGRRAGATSEELIGAQAPLAADIVRALGIACWPSGRANTIRVPIARSSFLPSSFIACLRPGRTGRLKHLLPP